MFVYTHIYKHHVDRKMRLIVTQIIIFMKLGVAKFNYDTVIYNFKMITNYECSVNYYHKEIRYGS